MALTPTYEHNATMKKLNINGSIYWLKDDDLRTIVEGFSNAVYKSVDITFDEDSVNLATSAAIANWVQDQIAGIEGAMHFRGVVERQTGETDAEAIARVITTPEAGDVVIMKDNGKEYIYDGTKWEEVGDQNIYETIAHAAATYVPKTRTIAGIDLQDDITVAELEAASALDLKALAHKASATGSVEVADDISAISTGAAGTYNVSQTAVSVPATYNALDVTPSGDVSLTAVTAAAATYQKTSGVTIAAAVPHDGQTANYTPAGTVSLPTLDASLDLKESAVATVTNSGTAYSITDGGVTQGNDTTAKFVKKGVSFSVNGTDPEQLDIAYVANTDTTFYDSAVTASGTVSYTKQELSGALPTFGSKDVVIKAGSTASAAYNGDASFAGSGVVIGASPSFETANATVTQPTFTAEFTGDAATVTPTVATTVSAAGTDGTVTVPTESITPTLNKKTVTVTVS